MSIPAFYSTNLKSYCDGSIFVMSGKDMSDEEFYRRYEASEEDTYEEFIERYGRSERELREIIDYLIEHRVLMRDVELERLEVEAKRLIGKLHSIDRDRLLEEVACFKDILALQKRLLVENGEPRS